MKKKILILPIIAGLFVSFSFGASAQVKNNADAGETGSISIVSDLNVTNFEILNQNKNNFRISFDLVAGNMSQPGVIYSVDLVKVENIQGRDVRSMIDKKVYDEKLYVAEKQTMHKEINYEAPNYFSGKYELWMEAGNDRGLIFATNRVGEIMLSGDGKYIDILSENCYLQVKGDPKNTKYYLTEGVDVSQEENLFLTCDIVNRFGKAIEVVPDFTIFNRSIFGDEVSEVQESKVSFGSGEKKTVVFDIPKGPKAQAYDAVLAFLDENEKKISNEVIFHYVIQGTNATIQNVSIDKNSYQKGEKIQININWTGSADSFPNARGRGSYPQKEFINLEVVDSEGNACVEKITKESNADSAGIEYFSLDVIRDCKNPRVNVAIKDQDGKILDASSYLAGNEIIKRPSITPIKKQTQGEVFNSRDIFKTIILITTFAGLLVVIFMLFKKNKKRYVSILFFAVILAVSLFFGAHNSEAKKINFTPGENNSEIPPFQTLGAPCRGCSGGGGGTYDLRDQDAIECASGSCTFQLAWVINCKKLFEKDDWSEFPNYCGEECCQTYNKGECTQMKMEYINKFKDIPNFESYKTYLLNNPKLCTQGCYGAIYNQCQYNMNCCNNYEYKYDPVYDDYRYVCVDFKTGCRLSLMNMQAALNKTSYIAGENMQLTGGYYYSICSNLHRQGNASFFLQANPHYEDPMRAGEDEEKNWRFRQIFDIKDYGIVNNMEWKYNSLNDTAPVDYDPELGGSFQRNNNQFNAFFNGVAGVSAGPQGSYLPDIFMNGFIGLVRFPYKVSCQDVDPNSVTFSSTTDTNITAGTNYNISCDFGSGSNPELIEAKNSVGTGTVCNRTTTTGTKAFFSCKSRVSDAGKELINTCTYGVPPCVTVEKTFNTSIVGACTPTCINNDQFCSSHADSCGTPNVCPGTKTTDCITTCTPDCGGITESDKHCGAYNDLNCGLKDRCTGTKPKDQCPIGWKECQSGSTDCTN